MESTAINTVYAVMHIVGETEFEIEVDTETSHGYLWSIYAREDKAQEECKACNEISLEQAKKGTSSIKDKFIVVEKKLF